MDLIIKNGTVVTPSGMFRADVGVQDGKIVEIAASISAEAKEVADAAGKLVLPGAIDGHTHLAMPFGGTISSDDYFAGTRAAACGGTTTVFDFAMQDFGESMVDTGCLRTGISICSRPISSRVPFWRTTATISVWWTVCWACSITG